MDEQRIDIIIWLLREYENSIDDSDYCRMAEIRFSIRDLQKMKDNIVGSKKS